MPRKARQSAEKPKAVLAAEQDAERLKDELAGEIRRTGTSFREASLALGMNEAYLTNLFRKRDGRDPSGIRLDTVLALLDLLGLRPSEFFAAYEARKLEAVRRRRLGVPTAERDEALGEPRSALPDLGLSTPMRGPALQARLEPSPILQSLVDELEDLLARARERVPEDARADHEPSLAERRALGRRG